MSSLLIEQLDVGACMPMRHRDRATANGRIHPRDPGQLVVRTAHDQPLIERLRHYFSTYELVPGDERKKKVAKVGKVYGREHALKVVMAAMADYDAAFMGGAGNRSTD